MFHHALHMFHHALHVFHHALHLISHLRLRGGALAGLGRPLLRRLGTTGMMLLMLLGPDTSGQEHSQYNG
jgi:hypothetical protein